MCSFIFFRSPVAVADDLLARANSFSRFRGPDHCSIQRFKDKSGSEITLLHNLLDISGTAAPQPMRLSKGDTTLHGLFNGEIYNFRALGSYTADTQCILPAWLEFGANCGKIFDGEYAIVIYDESTQRLAVLTDTFLTKPVYYGLDAEAGNCGVATCASSLSELGFRSVSMCRPNSLLLFDFNGGKNAIEQTHDIYKFGLDQQAESFDEWNKAFLKSVERRARHGSHRPVVFLSSGYDSGAICLALNLLGIGYDTFSIAAGENVELLRQRIAMNQQRSSGRAFVHPGLSRSELHRIQSDIQASVEPFTYVHEDQPGVISDLQHDGGALGSYFLARWAREENCCVNLSGAGADEIISDYGWNGDKFYSHSEFGGRFPEDLHGFFPWKKFYDDTQRSYLFKEEYILGRWGIEGRYPFLDRGVVQAFLSLTPGLKNEQYKAPIKQFLDLHGYPCETKCKRGFAPGLPDTQPQGHGSGRLKTLLRWLFSRNS